MHHKLSVTLDPQSSTIGVRDEITLPQTVPTEGWGFALGDRFRLKGVNGADVIPVRSQPGGRRYKVVLPPGKSRFTLIYSGTIEREQPVGRGGMPRAVIDSEGVYLDGNSGWYPDFAGMLVRFDLQVEKPSGWRTVSQGALVSADDASADLWRTRNPQDDIYLVAGPYTLYRDSGSRTEAQVFLARDEADLARRYLELTHRYIDLFSRLIGPYPYPKFATVENRWETGFGMPSFTLLGPRVMRLPFILTSSYPHEILHNWWGNGVYTDYESGNWSEGLTSYLADHLIKAMQGEGVRHRRETLQEYADYVDRDRDFPLTAFRARHDGATQAVGYDKTLMFFHMLRRQIGDAAFLSGIRRLYRDYRFRKAGYPDLERLFSAEAGRDLGPFFRQWLQRTGAPELGVSGVRVDRIGERWRVSGRIEQRQSGKPYRLEIPVAIALAGKQEGAMRRIVATERTDPFAFDFADRPLRIDIDPRFDLFRRLTPGELPPSLGQIFGAPRFVVVVPEAAPADRRAAWMGLAKAWARRYPDTQIVTDREPLDPAVPTWILGSDNRHAAALHERLAERSLAEKVTGDVDPAKDSTVATMRVASGTTWGLVLAPDTGAVSALARKLPHYGRYSRLAFRGREAVNVARGTWRVDDSPMTVQLGPESVAAPRIPAEPPLIDAADLLE